MKIRMLSTQHGADDGVTLRTYGAGEEYVLPDTGRGLDLAAVFLREGWAEEVKAAVRAEPETVSASAATQQPAASARGRRR